MAWLKIILGFVAGLFSFFHDRKERQAGADEINLQQEENQNAILKKQRDNAITNTDDADKLFSIIDKQSGSGSTHNED